MTNDPSDQARTRRTIITLAILFFIAFIAYLFRTARPAAGGAVNWTPIITFLAGSASATVVALLTNELHWHREQKNKKRDQERRALEYALTYERTARAIVSRVEVIGTDYVYNRRTFDDFLGECEELIGTLNALLPPPVDIEIVLPDEVHAQMKDLVWAIQHHRDLCEDVGFGGAEQVRESSHGLWQRRAQKAIAPRRPTVR